jgi:hypothetical protein
VGYSWIDQLKLEAERTVTDLQMKFAASRFPQSTPLTKVISSSRIRRSMTGGQSQIRHRAIVLGRQHMQSGGPVRQPYAGVDFISPVRIYELGYSFADSEFWRGGLAGEVVPDPLFFGIDNGGFVVD